MAAEPILLGKVDYSEKAGKNCKMLLGDLNADGRMEMVMIQADGEIDDRYVPHQLECVTAFDMNGNMLWQVGKPVENPGRFGSDFPAQVYDIDGDGKLEVLCVINKKFKIINGQTGEIKKEYDLPDNEAHDCILIANLTGSEYPQNIILKNRYKKIWAMDKDFNVMWEHEGRTGHFPYAYDIDGDGCDEIMAGYDMLDQDGKLLWDCNFLDDHADCLWFGDVNGDGKVEVAVGGSITVLFDTKGNEIWRHTDTKESQHIALGKFLENEKGLQMAGLDRIIRGDRSGRGQDGMFLVSSEGKTIWKENREFGGWLTIVDTFRNWNGEGKDYILGYRRGGGVNPTFYDGEMKAVITFPEDGYVVHGDLFGRGKEDVIIYTPETAFIYSGTYEDLTKAPSGKQLPQPKRLYTSTLYPGGEYNE